MKDFNKWIEEIHGNSVERGLYDCPKCKGVPKKINEDVYDYSCEYCNNTGIDPNKSIEELLMNIVIDIGKASDACRCEKFADWKMFEKLTSGFKFKQFPEVKQCLKETEAFELVIKDTREDKIADVFIGLFDLCGYLGYKDVSKYVNESYGDCLYLDSTAKCLFLINCRVVRFFNSEKNFLEIIDMARILSVLVNFCKSRNISIEKHVKAKMVYSKNRPYVWKGLLVLN